MRVQCISPSRTPYGLYLADEGREWWAVVTTRCWGPITINNRSFMTGGTPRATVRSHSAPTKAGRTRNWGHTLGDVSKRQYIIPFKIFFCLYFPWPDEQLSYNRYMSVWIISLSLSCACLSSICQITCNLLLLIRGLHHHRNIACKVWRTISVGTLKKDFS